MAANLDKCIDQEPKDEFGRDVYLVGVLGLSAPTVEVAVNDMQDIKDPANKRNNQKRVNITAVFSSAVSIFVPVFCEVLVSVTSIVNGPTNAPLPSYLWLYS